MKLKLRIEGSIYGYLIGNALGTRCENKKLTSSTIQQQLAKTYSDIGCMSLCTMISLMESQRVDIEDIMYRFQDWYLGSYLVPPNSKIKSSVNISQAIRHYGNGFPADKCGSKESPTDNSALARMLPVALWNARNPLESMIEDSHQVTRITNQHIEAEVCSDLYCMAIQSIMFQEKTTIDETLMQYYEKNNLTKHKNALTNIKNFLKKGDLQGTQEVKDCFWSSISIDEKHGFEEAMIGAILFGNDCARTTAITGSLVGLSLGINEIPHRWIKQLELTHEVKDLLKSFIDKITSLCKI